MKSPSISSALAVLAFASSTLAVGSLAQAQCPAWQPGFQSLGGDGLAGAGGVVATVHDDGSGSALYVGGAFSSAGSTAARNIARWDGAAWSALGTGANTEVVALAGHDDGSGTALYAGGRFTEIGGVTTRGVARWNGSAWSAVGGGIAGSGFVQAIAEYDDGTSNKLYVGGEFLSMGSVPARGIASWDGSAWSAVGSLPGETYVNALVVHDDGSGPALYAGGSILTITGKAEDSTFVVRWDGTTWTTVGTGLRGFFGTLVFALASHDDGHGSKLYVGGNFDLGANVPNTRFLARWNGSAYESVGGGSPFDYWVSAFETFDEGAGRGPELFLGGTGSSGLGREAIVRWDGAAYSSVAGGLDASSGARLYGLRTYDAGLGAGRQLYALGAFTSAGALPSTGIAVLSSCGETGRTLCYGDASGTACPCGNASASGDREGCLNSSTFGGRLRASGDPTLTHDTLVLEGSRMRNGSALYFQGTSASNGGSGATFGDGLRCAAGSVRRLAIVANAAGASTYPGVGDAPIATIGAVARNGTRVYQVWYRDAAAYCTPSTFNLTNAVEIVWTN